MRNIVQLKTKGFYREIEKRLSWDKKFSIGYYNDTSRKFCIGSLTYVTLKSGSHLQKKIVLFDSWKTL